jgi:hypothetical protein
LALGTGQQFGLQLLEGMGIGDIAQCPWLQDTFGNVQSAFGMQSRIVTERLQLQL